MIYRYMYVHVCVCMYVYYTCTCVHACMQPIACGPYGLIFEDRQDLQTEQVYIFIDPDLHIYYVHIYVHTRT